MAYKTFDGTSQVFSVSNSFARKGTEILGIPVAAHKLTATNSSQPLPLSSDVTRISIKSTTGAIRYSLTGPANDGLTASQASHYVGENERIDIAVPIGSTLYYIRDHAETANQTIEITELT